MITNTFVEVILNNKAMQTISAETKLKKYSGMSPRQTYYLTVISVDPLSANLIKWSNTLKQFLGNLPTNCLSVFDHLVGFALKGLRQSINPVINCFSVEISKVCLYKAKTYIVDIQYVTNKIYLFEIILSTARKGARKENLLKIHGFQFSALSHKSLNVIEWRTNL